MAARRGSDDTVDGRSPGHPFASFLRHSGERKDEESDAVAGGRGGHLAAAHPGAEGGRSWLLHVPAQHQTHVEPAGMRGRSRYV